MIWRKTKIPSVQSEGEAEKFIECLPAAAPARMQRAGGSAQAEAKLEKLSFENKFMAKKDFKKGEIIIYKTPQNEVELKVLFEKENI